MTKKYLLLAIICLPFWANSQDLYDLSRVREVRLTFEEDIWDKKLNAYKQEGKDRRLLGKVTIDGMVYDSVGVRYKGNSSYFNIRKTDSKKLPFNIKIDYIKKKQALPGGYESLKLSNVFRDPSFMREALAYEIANKYMVAPRANFVRLYVNGELLGLYNNTESVNKDFLKKYYDYGKGVTFKCDPSWEYKKPDGCNLGDKASLQYLGEDPKCYQNLYEIKSKKGWEELIKLTKTLNKNPDEIESVLDVDATLWMLAFNNVLVNLDSYSGRLCHNYYMYQDTFGIFHPIPWDMNLNFGGFRFFDAGSPMTLEAMQKMSPFIHYSQSNDKRPLIVNLLKNSLYRKVYMAHIRTILNDFFVNEKYLNRARQMQSSIDFYVQSDKNKFYPYEFFKKNLESSCPAGSVQIVGLKELMKARTEYLTNHPLLKKESPKISEVFGTKSGESESKIQCRVSGADKVYVCYRQGKYAPWKRIEMKEEGADGKYLSMLEGGSGLEYYIIAEAAKTASLSPERSGKETHVVR